MNSPRNPQIRAIVVYLLTLCVVVPSRVLFSADGHALEVATPVKWVRPADWAPLPDVAPGEQKMVGLFAVHPHRANWTGVRAAGDFVVDWGDGSAPQNFKGGTVAEHEFDYATCRGAECSRGYKMVIVTVTPQSGQRLTQLDLNQQRGDDRLTGWLDLTISSKDLSKLIIAARNPCVCHRLLEQTTIKEHCLTDTSYLFNICESLQSVPWFDTSRIVKMDAMFWGAMKLQTIPLFDTSNVTSMNDMFRECYDLVAVPHLNTAKVTSMSCAFRYAISLRTVPLFETSNVTNMTMLFQYCWSLQRVPHFNTSRVINMRWMFQDCYLLKSIPAFDTSNVTEMRAMFSGAQTLMVLPALDVSKVEDFSRTFNGCTQLTQNQMHGAVRDLDLSNQNLSAAELNRIYSRLGTVQGKTIQVSGNYGVLHHDPSIAVRKGWTVKAESPAVATGATSQQFTKVAPANPVELTLPVKGSKHWVRAADWPTLPEVKPDEQAMIGLFAVFPLDDNFVAFSAAGDYEVDWGDGSANEKFSADATAAHRFDHATCGGAVCGRGYKTVLIKVTPQAGQSLTTLDLQKRHSAVSVSGAATVRTNWLDLKISGKELSSLAIGRKAPVVFPMLLEQVTIHEHRLTSTAFLFHQCSALESVPLFDTSNVTSMRGMFAGARNISSLPLFDTRNVTSLADMFRDCGSLAEVPPFQTSNVTTMAEMFHSAFMLRTLPNWDTSNVTDMTGMFENAWRFHRVPALNTSKVTSMQRMFRQTALTTIPHFDTSNVVDMKEMFYWTLRLERVPALDVRKVKDFSGIFGSGVEGRCQMLVQNEMIGISNDIDLSHESLSAAELNRIFSRLPRVQGKVISINNNEGADTCDRSLATSKGWIINAPPVLNAGPDQTLTLPNTITLKAIATDEGYPNPPGGMTFVWFFGGFAPGPVQFSSQRSQSVTLTFTTPGRYVFRCAAFDGHLTTEDDVVVLVKPQGASGDD